MQIASKQQTYKDADTTLNGIFFWDESQTIKRPGVMVVHGGVGLDDHARNRARRFAELGYVAFACDMYGEGVAGNRERIMACINELRAEPGRIPRRATAGIDVLRSPAQSASMAASTRNIPPRPTPSRRKSSSATARSTRMSRSLKSPPSLTK
jgi:dienelactone hydrolase